MSQNDELRWDRQHGASEGAEQPSSFLVDIFSAGIWPLVPGRALDVACGKGRNSLFLAARGFEVTGIDLSEVALAEARRRAQAKGLSISFQQADLESARLAEALYDLIIHFNYLQRSLIPQLHSALRIGGHVIFETYLIDQKEIGHPRNPEYLLAHNELLRLFSSFRVLYYREGKNIESGAASFRAGLLAQKVA
jgi:2-polyprenyl-3-methyl-5-hydroxy-6-metoxy-1,4-benzoquinol methylase